MAATETARADGAGTVQAAAASTALVGDARKLLGLLGAVVAPATLVTALAYYFGWRRERAFASYFGIDPSVLGFSSADYVLRSVDALFVPVGAILLAALTCIALNAVLGRRLERAATAKIAAAAGVAALALGLAFAAGHPVSSSFGYLQALAPGVGVVLVAYALGRRRGVSPQAAAGVRYLAAAIALVSLFWATAEYADSRGRGQAEQLARDLTVNPSVTIFSKNDLDVATVGPGSGEVNGCPALTVVRRRSATCGYSYTGFTLLIRSGGNYFLTPTPSGPWNAANNAIFVVRDDADVRVELMRGTTYPAQELEGTIHPQRPAFTC
jgi:hypothetical protein